MTSKEKLNDAVKIAPHMHSVIFENAKIRVLKVIVRPKDRAEMHWHPENYVLSNQMDRHQKLRLIRVR